MALTPERQAAILSTLRMMEDDIAEDVKKWDNTPFTGVGELATMVAVMHGELSAVVQALTKIVKELIES